MGEIAEALERAREAKRQADEEADAAEAASRASQPRSRDRSAVAREWMPGESPRPPAAARELSLESVRAKAPQASPSAEPASIAHVAAAPSAPRGPSIRRTIELSREKDEHWRARAVIVDPESSSAVRFPHLAVRIRAALDASRVPSLLVTSALKGEGKTTVSTNLALALAMIASDRRVAFVDLDLRSASVAAVMGVRKGPGIEDVMAGSCELEAACLSTDVASLDLYPVLRPTRQAHELLGWAAERVLEELVERYDYVIADGPPVLPVPDTPLLAPLFGGCLAVVRSRYTRHSAFQELLDLMPRSQLLGVFLNDAMERRDRDAYGYYGRNLDELEEDEEGAEVQGEPGMSRMVQEKRGEKR
ncbi:MAG: CpsD/CapB family tyrosine-protein kinase [Myxococcota bacterium]